MIKITSLSQLEKYKTKEFYNPVDDCDHITYTFETNGVLQDVEFDIDINFCLEKQLQTLPLEQNFFRHSFVAKNIKFNIGCVLYKVVAENLYSKNICDIEQIEIKNNISADRLASENIVAKNIEANCCIISKSIKCKHIDAKKIVFSA